MSDLLSDPFPQMHADPCSDPWLWRAHYDDITDPDHETLDELDPDADTYHAFAAIDQSRLVLLELVPTREELPAHFLTLPAGSRPIFFRRRHVVSGPSAGPDGATVPGGPDPITVLGWQRTLDVGGARRNVQSFTFLTSDGQVVVADDRDALNFGDAPDFDPVLTARTP